MATIERSVSAAVVSHYNIQPVFDVYANVDQRDLGSVATEVRKLAERSQLAAKEVSSLADRSC